MEAPIRFNLSVPHLPQEPVSCDYDSDEIHMNDTAAHVFFSDTLMDLKNLRKQLYSAAEYFEHSYTNDDQKNIVVKTLKDYAIKAIVNTVDHLGSASYKVKDFLDKKTDQVSGTDLLVSCIEQRVKTCQDFIDREGLSQQSSVINIPKYHKRYILPAVGEAMNGANGVESTSRECSLQDEDEWYRFKHAASIRGDTPPPSRVGQSPSPSSRFPQQNIGNAIPPIQYRKESEEKGRRASSNRFPLLLLRSESVSSQQTTPTKSRWPTTPNPSSTQPITLNPSSIEKQQPQRSFSMRFHSERFHQPKDCENNNNNKGSKSKRLLKALLSRRKSKRDDTLYTYLDEY